MAVSRFDSLFAILMQIFKQVDLNAVKKRLDEEGGLNSSKILMHVQALYFSRYENSDSKKIIGTLIQICHLMQTNFTRLPLNVVDDFLYRNCENNKKILTDAGLDMSVDSQLTIT